MQVASGDCLRQRILGRGSSATVSLAATSSGELFVIKYAEFSRSKLVQREQRILSSLASPYLISYIGFDINTINGVSYYNLLLEYATGGSLYDHIENSGGKMNELEFSSYAADVLNGLTYIHANELVHCDIKGQNVLICADGCAKIADFGCSRWLDNEDDNDIGFMGTPMFMAPEVVRGEEQGKAADIWAFGCMVLEMITARPPWAQVSDPVVVIHRIGFSDDLPEIPGWISDVCKDFLGKCLVRDPKARWSAEQLLEHPYVKNSKSGLAENKPWVSPKSILDQEWWELDSSSDSSQDDQEVLDDPIQRILDVMAIGGTENVPCWSCEEENWMTVRCKGNECSSTLDVQVEMLENLICFDTSFSRRGVTEVMTVSNSNHHMENEDFDDS